MSPIVHQIKEQCAGLSVQDRADLAYFLLHSLDEEDADPEADVDAAWREEIRRRMAEIRSGNAKGKPADQVLQELREKYT